MKPREGQKRAIFPSLIWGGGGVKVFHLFCPRLLLVYDSFEAHVTDTVKASFKCENTELAVIPGGLTSLLQPLDVSLNKLFKDGVRKQWMADGIHEFTVRRFRNSIRNDRCLFSEV